LKTPERNFAMFFALFALFAVQNNHAEILAVAHWIPRRHEPPIAVLDGRGIENRVSEARVDL